MRLNILALAVAICAPVAAFADDMTIAFGNNSWDALSAVEYAPTGTDSFTAIALPEGQLVAGGFVDQAIADGTTICTYDLRFTKADGSVAERLGVDLCAATYYHFADE